MTAHVVFDLRLGFIWGLAEVKGYIRRSPTVLLQFERDTFRPPLQFGGQGRRGVSGIGLFDGPPMGSY